MTRNNHPKKPRLRFSIPPTASRRSGGFAHKDCAPIRGRKKVPGERHKRDFAKDFRRVADRVAEVGEDEWFDEFVKTSRRLADSTKKHMGGREFTVVSKLLWHRHPTRGFIRDTKAFKMLRDLLPRYLREPRWGHDVGPGSERNFLRFAAGYERHFLHLHDPIAKALRSVGRDEADKRASRVVDKFLWRSPPKHVKVTPDDHDFRIADAAISVVESESRL